MRRIKSFKALNNRIIWWCRQAFILWNNMVSSCLCKNVICTKINTFHRWHHWLCNEWYLVSKLFSLYMDISRIRKFICIQNLGLAVLTLMGKEVGPHFTKNYYDWRCMICPDKICKKLHVCKPLTPHRQGIGVNLLKKVMLGITSNVKPKHIIENPCLATPITNLLNRFLLGIVLNVQNYSERSCLLMLDSMG